MACGSGWDQGGLWNLVCATTHNSVSSDHHLKSAPPLTCIQRRITRWCRGSGCRDNRFVKGEARQSIYTTIPTNIWRAVLTIAGERRVGGHRKREEAECVDAISMDQTSLLMFRDVQQLKSNSVESSFALKISAQRHIVLTQSLHLRGQKPLLLLPWHYQGAATAANPTVVEGRQEITSCVRLGLS